MFFWGGGILWLTSNFLSSRTKVAGKLHPSLPQRFINSQRKHKKLHSCGRHVGGAICELIPVLIWASACRGGGGLPLWSSKGASRLQRPLVGFNFLLKKYRERWRLFLSLLSRYSFLLNYEFTFQAGNYFAKDGPWQNKVTYTYWFLVRYSAENTFHKESRV